MLFNSYAFIFMFLPVALAGYFALGRGSSRTPVIFLARAWTLAQAKSGLGACRNSAGSRWLRFEGSANAGEATAITIPPAVKPQSGQWSMWFSADGPELSPWSAVSADICFMPSGVQISLKIESPRAWFSACEIVGANASPKIASMAIDDRRRRR